MRSTPRAGSSGFERTLMHEIVYFATGLLCYALGSIPFGYLAVRWKKGEDVRKHGSGSVGATNVARVLGWGWFFPVFGLDFIKGFVPVFFIAPWVAEHFPCNT